MHRPLTLGKLAVGCAAALAAFAGADAAVAQTMNANSATYNAGYGRYSDEENAPVNPTVRDANGNLVVVDGMIETGQDQSIFSNAGAGGAIDTVAGVSAGGSASAVGNNLVVVTQGDNNTVIVNSKQTNNGAVSASSSVNGGVGNAQ